MLERTGSRNGKIGKAWKITAWAHGHPKTALLCQEIAELLEEHYGFAKAVDLNDTHRDTGLTVSHLYCEALTLLRIAKCEEAGRDFYSTASTSDADYPAVSDDELAIVLKNFAQDLRDNNPLILNVLAAQTQQAKAQQDFAEVSAREFARSAQQVGLDPADVKLDKLPEDMKAERTRQMKEYGRLLVESRSFNDARSTWLKSANNESQAFNEWFKSWANPLAPLSTPSVRAPDFFFQTGQEFDVLQRAGCDGSKGKNYLNDLQAGTRTHSVSASHSVRLALTDEERDAGLDVAALERLTCAQDADCAFALLYVSRALLPRAPGPLPADLYAGGMIELDDVIKKIGWNPRSTKDREAMRQKVWDYLLFGARASVVGQRTGTYRDPNTGEVINTRIDSPLWSFLKRERASVNSPQPEQPTLFPALQVPLRVEVLVNRDWTHLCQSPALAQYLPMGELLGAIAPEQPSGAWARVLGLSLANLWRRQPRAALDGSIKPTRRELLDHYRAKVAPYDELLSSNNPRRVVEYWGQALGILAESGFLEHSGEAARTVPEMLKSLPRQGWQEAWLDGTVELRPGSKMHEAVRERVAALPAPKPRVLRGPNARKSNGSKSDGSAPKSHKKAREKTL